jgi:prevent-host-death family protein
MKTATVRELRNEYKRVLGWAEAGEEVAISRRGKIIARIVPAKPQSKRVDWTKSAAFALHRKRKEEGHRVLTAEESAALRAESQGFEP